MGFIMSARIVDLRDMDNITGPQKTFLRKVQTGSEIRNKETERPFFHINFRQPSKDTFICFCLKNTRTKKKVFVFFQRNGDIDVEIRQCVPNTHEYVDQHYVIYHTIALSALEAQSETLLSEQVDKIFEEALKSSTYVIHAKEHGYQLLKTQLFSRVATGSQICAGRILGFEAKPEKITLRTHDGAECIIPLETVKVNFNGNPIGQWVVTNSKGTTGIYTDGKFKSRFLPPSIN